MSTSYNYYIKENNCCLKRECEFSIYQQQIKGIIVCFELNLLFMKIIVR